MLLSEEEELDKLIKKVFLEHQRALNELGRAIVKELEGGGKENGKS